ncbi:MAG TPA: GTPase [Thermoguttaceae bacterium]|nr:GTPase [Thermoguttaceae bacterium]
MSEPSSPRVVQLTPPGRGAIASLLVEGPDAANLVESGFVAAGGRPLVSYPLGQIVFGRFSVESHPGEDIVACRRSEHSVELHCHGGQAAVARVREMLVRRGCRVGSWQEWIAGQHEDRIAREARIALADARTERTAGVLLDQYHGALRRAVEAVRDSLTAGNARTATEQLQNLLARAELGRHLVQPWRVILAGAPNVGKSSLINALVGYRRAIVHAAAGTTRDIVSATTAIDGWPIELSDTAGLRQSEHALEQAAIELAQRQLASADLVLLVFDFSQPWSDADQTLWKSRPEGLVVHNKCDLPQAPDPPCPYGLLTSALTGAGMEALVRAIAERLAPDSPPPGAAVPFDDDQIVHLRETLAAISRHDSPAALAALEGLLK